MSQKCPKLLKHNLQPVLLYLCQVFQITLWKKKFNNKKQSLKDIIEQIVFFLSLSRHTPFFFNALHIKFSYSLLFQVNFVKRHLPSLSGLYNQSKSYCFLHIPKLTLDESRVCNIHNLENLKHSQFYQSNLIIQHPTTVLRWFLYAILNGVL